MARTILIVDDMASSRMILRNILCDDYEVIEASNGKDAQEIILRQCQSLSAILLDIVMPQMSGYEVLEWARSNLEFAQIPIVMITGSEDEGSRVKALALGANDFILKPYNSEIVKHCLKNSISLREASVIANLAQKDKLTGLYNREAFFDKAKQLIYSHEAGHFVMVCLDIDNFKFVNDQYGTDEGDRILKHVAAEMQRTFDAVHGLCGRISGDNFAAVFPYCQKYIDYVSQKRETEFIPPDTIATLRFSAGRYIIEDLSLSVSSMYDRAYIAKQSVKGKYGQNVAYFDNVMLESITQEQSIIRQMDTALAEHQFEVWFQPQYNHSTGALIGAEALARWRHPEEGILPPTLFIPVFEKNGFVYELDKYIWEQVLICLRKWIDEGRNPLPISVNISRYDLFMPDLIAVLTGLAEKYGVPIDLLRLEITESAFSQSPEHIVQIVEELVDIGFSIEIDDFGSGYSSLNTLKNVPAQVVKLDMRFLDDDGDSQRGGNILESIVRMVKWLEMSVIAEGVENKEQADFLKSIGCSYVQGYLYARPMPLADYEAHCKNAKKEEHLLTVETVENLDKNTFWNPHSMDTLIFNSFVGAACIFEYIGRRIELLRANDTFAQILGDGTITAADTLKLNWISCLAPESLQQVRDVIARSAKSGESISGEYVFHNIPGGRKIIHLRASMRVIASAGERLLIYCLCENITAQRLAEQSGRRLKNQLQAVLDNVNCGITAVTFNGDGVDYILTNNRYYELLGYTREQYHSEIGGHAYDVIFPGDRQRVAETVKRVIADCKPAVLEYRVLRRDGGIVWLRVSVSMTNFEGVDKPAQLCAYTDITDKQEALEQLRMSEEENRLAIRHSKTVVCRYDIATRALTLSPNVSAIFEMPAVAGDVPYGEVKSGRISPETAGAYTAFYESILHGEKDGDLIFQRLSTSGWRWIEAHFSTVFTDSGEPSSAVISFHDVTETFERDAAYKKWIQSIKTKDPKTYSLLRCTLAPETVIDTQEGALLCTRKAPEKFNFVKRIAGHIASHVHPEDQDDALTFLDIDALKANYYQGQHSSTMELREMLPNGNYRWIRLTIDLVEHPHAADIEAYLLFEDIDREKRAELHTLERAQMDPLTGVYNRATFKEKVDRIIQTTKPNVRHAMMMLDIDGFKQVNDSFGHSVGDQTLVETAATLQSSMRRNDLVGRLGGDEFAIFIEDIPSDTAIKNKAKQICELLRKSFSIEVEISGSIGIAVTPRDGTDFESLYKKADSALYYVKGSGKDNYAFYQDDMADQHLELHEEADNHPGAPRQDKKRRMLIVDDSVIDHTLLANIFANDFIVEKAKDGNTALIRLRHYGSAISVVLLDLIMPGMDGFAVLKKMQAAQELRNIPVIVVSGDESRESGLRAIRAGAVDYVMKPVDPDVLRIRVQSAISKAENQRLRAKNTFLELQSGEIMRYRTALERSGIVVVENNLGTGAFIYDPAIAEHIAGEYDGRKLWQILLSDSVADTHTVKGMQETVDQLIMNVARSDASMLIELKVPSGDKHWFRMNAFKTANESGIATKIYFTFTDVGTKKPSDQ